jgi:hypothetical protein
LSAAWNESLHVPDKTFSLVWLAHCGQFRFAAINSGPTPEQVVPSAMSGIESIGIQKAAPDSSIKSEKALSSYWLSHFLMENRRPLSRKMF